jgi:hypothetical protein
MNNGYQNIRTGANKPLAGVLAEMRYESADWGYLIGFLNMIINSLQMFWQRWFKNRVVVTEEKQQLVVEEPSEDEERQDLSDHTVRSLVDAAASVRLAKRFARDARMFLPIYGRDLATEMVVKDWLRREMVAYNVRRRDIATILPLALHFSFVKTIEELNADTYALTDHYRMLERLTNEPMYVRDKPTLLNWFGTKRYLPRAAVS